MQIEVLMTTDDFVALHQELLRRTGMEMYVAQTYNDPVRRVDMKTYRPVGMPVLMLIGPAENGKRIEGMLARHNLRADKVGFVDIVFGAENEDAIGTTTYLADPSDAAKLIGRELKKLLKTKATLGVTDQTMTAPVHKVWWTPAALASSKNWKSLLRTGAQSHRNREPGWRPLPKDLPPTS